MKSKQTHILLVEDEKFIAHAYKDGLEGAGFQITIATDGLEAMAALRKGAPYNLVLLDLIMPNKSGFEVLEEMRADSALKKIPVLILSNLGQDSDIAQGKALGAVDYLVKSNFSMKEVIAKVTLHCARQH